MKDTTTVILVEECKLAILQHNKPVLQYDFGCCVFLLAAVQLYIELISGDVEVLYRSTRE